MPVEYLDADQYAERMAKPVGRGVRFLALDGLRGIAALVVVLHHIRWPNHVTNNNFITNGYLAVDVFFILSGFIIMKKYVGRISNITGLANFIRLRIFRIYPLHLAVLIVLVCLELVKFAIQGVLATSSEQPPFTNENSITALAANGVLLNGLHTLDSLSWNIPSWSISCEFSAYIVFGITVLSGLIRRRLFFPSVVLLAGCSYGILAFERDGLDVTYDWGIVRCLAGFFLGALVAGVDSGRNSTADRFVGSATVATMVVIIVTMSVATGRSVVLVVPLFVLAIALLQNDIGPVARILMRSMTQYLGRISYSIYMMQFLVVLCITIIAKRVVKVPLVFDSHTQKLTLMINPWIGDILLLGTVLALILLSGLTYVWIESPGRAFGRRLGLLSRSC
jgi:peptidoglycan/LPS O-acetylase OafA/YrhL